MIEPYPTHIFNHPVHVRRQVKPNNFVARTNVILDWTTNINKRNDACVVDVRLHEEGENIFFDELSFGKLFDVKRADPSPTLRSEFFWYA